MTSECDAAVGERILTPAFVRLLVAAVASGVSFYLLLSVVPLYVAAGGSSGAGAGLTTGVMLAATVLGELAMTALLARFGYRAMVAGGLLLFGLPTLLLTVSDALPLVLAVCAARGAGLAIMVVAGTALVAELVPPHRRGEGLGVYGFAAGVPAILGLPLGVYLSGWIGFDAVFVLAAGVALAGLVAVPGLPGRIAAVPRRIEVRTSKALLRPAVVFAAVTFAIGVVVTFLPLAVPDRTRLVAGALLVQALIAPLARWAAGRYGDRRGYDGLLIPAVVLTGLGVATLIWYGEPLAVICGMVAFGIGYGAAQTVTLSIMFQRGKSGAHGRVSAVWNLAYDAGMGLGAVGFGLLVGTTGYPLAFGLTAALLAVVLPLARR